MNVSSLIARYIFKVRNIYEYSPSTSKTTTAVDSYTVSQFRAQVPSHLASARLNRLLKDRQPSAAWTLFCAWEGGVLKGYSFLHAPSKIEWHDSLPTFRGQARESSTYVEPQFRGANVRGLLLLAQRDYCEKQQLRFWAVIEKANEASIKSTLRNSGTKTRANYLVKLAGTNVTSVLTDPLRVYILVGRRRKRL